MTVIANATAESHTDLADPNLLERLARLEAVLERLESRQVQLREQLELRRLSMRRSTPVRDGWYLQFEVNSAATPRSKRLQHRQPTSPEAAPRQIASRVTVARA